jgi:hypothetical protein
MGDFGGRTEVPLGFALKIIKIYLSKSYAQLGYEKIKFREEKQ